MRRKTKEQREAAAKAALRQRIADIAAGAFGGEFDADGEFATADLLSRFVPALQARLKHTDPQIKLDYCWKPHNLHYFDNVDTATDFLFDQAGVRA